MLGRTVERRSGSRTVRHLPHIYTIISCRRNRFLHYLYCVPVLWWLKSRIILDFYSISRCHLYHEKRDFLLEWEQCSDIYAIYFDPVFININMTIPALRSELTPDLQETFGFFHLSPFLLENPDKLYIQLNEETADSLLQYFFYFQHELEEQPDWYWSCRARSYFMDIIGVLERIYHNYYISPALDHCSSQAIPSELQNILLHINNHLESDLKLDDICQKFLVNRNHVERMFRLYLDDTFYGYIKARRLDRIRYYLRFTELRAKEICHRVGFPPLKTS